MRHPPGAASAATHRPHRAARRVRLRAWSVRHARFHERLYAIFAGLLLRLDWLWRWVGYARIERPLVPFERSVKSALFDCRMCGECILTSTGMACPMTCPKGLRNGPCGGVRADGGCEIEPAMRCVWVEAWEGSRRMAEGDRIAAVQKPLDHSLGGTSAWLRVTARAAAERQRRRSAA